MSSSAGHPCLRGRQVPAGAVTRLLAPLLVLAAACGSTVPLSAGASPGSDTSNISAAGTASGNGSDRSASAPAGAAGGSGPQGVAAEGATATGSRSGGPAAGGSGSVTAPGAAARQVSVPGITATSVSIGVLTLNEGSGYIQAAGVKGANFGDQQAMARSMIASLNAHGGLAGRRVVPVFYDVNVANYESDEASEAQAACAAFTQDAHVYAVSSVVAWGDETFYRCLAQHHVMVSAPEFSTQRMLRLLPDTLYVPDDPNQTRSLADSVDALSRAGWFGTSPRIGVIGVSTPDSQDSIDNGLLPALRAHGYRLAAAPQYLAAGAAGESQYANAVLQLRSAQVDHVFFGEGATVLLFAEAAQSQKYYPAYEIDSIQDPGGSLEANLQPQTLHGSMGLGWLPEEDLDGATSTGWPSVHTPGEPSCVAAEQASGQDLSQGSIRLEAFWTCDNFAFLDAALRHATDVTPGGFRAAAESLGTGFLPATTFQTDLAPGRLHDGAAQYRLNAYVDSCPCYRYVTGLRPLP